MDFARLGLGTLSLTVILEYFHLKQESLVIFSVLLVIDFLLGVIHAYMKDKQTVSSTKMWIGLFKKFIRFTIPFSAVMVLRGVGFKEIEFLISSIMAILIASEGYSILRHYMYIAAKKEMSEIDAIEYVLQKIIEVVRPSLPEKKKDKNV